MLSRSFITEDLKEVYLCLKSAALAYDLAQMEATETNFSIFSLGLAAIYMCTVYTSLIGGQIDYFSSLFLPSKELSESLSSSATSNGF